MTDYTLIKAEVETEDREKNRKSKVHGKQRSCGWEAIKQSSGHLH